MRRVTSLLLLACVVGAGMLAHGASADDVRSTQGFIQRSSGGGGTFALKAANAAAAGAAGVIIFNEGEPDRTGLISGRRPL